LLICPDQLQGLVQRQALVLHDETWDQDVQGLVRSLRGELAVPTRRSRRWLVGGEVAAATLYGRGPTLMVVTSPVAGSMRETVSSPSLATHTAPSPTAILAGNASTGMVATFGFCV
jgi:hypothetical protein